MDIIQNIAEQLQLTAKAVQSTIDLLDEGATIPFISRYRKEYTGGLDEVAIRDIDTLYKQMLELEKRKAYIVETIESQGNMTDELRHQIEDTTDSNVLEDLYLPFKPKRRTRATVARENGLEPLAKMLMAQNSADIYRAAARFVTENVADVEAALQGAKDIIAEWVNESAGARTGIRNKMQRVGVISAKVVKGKEKEAANYRNYQNYSQQIKRCPSHQYLALRRGEREGLLRVGIDIDENSALDSLYRIFVQKNGNEQSVTLVKEAVNDGYKRLMLPSIENEVAAMSKVKADEEAIKLFADNLRQLLMASPLGRKRVMAVDPGFRTGCKVVCLDEQGNLLCHDVIYPVPPRNERVTAMRTVNRLVTQHKIDAIAIGNGTASRETEQFFRVLQLSRPVQIFVVSEAGASVYSASDVAREEFPDHDVTVRGAVSIGRRLIDPLAELVKIDPKSIGVGQYQHDVDQAALRDSLDYTVMSCVNTVGVNVNTASVQLLSYISGIGPQLASNIVKYRTENGDFTSRRELMNVPRLGSKAFEQAAGFLRIPDAENPLDNSAVHPESYAIVEKMAKDAGVKVEQLLRNEELISKIDINKYVTDKVGLPTLNDILAELRRPGRDPRGEAEVFEFDPTIMSIEDVKPGSILNGIVENITAFGAFVNIGIHESGLVHVSQMAKHKVSNPADVVKLHQQVKVRVLDVDLERNRIALSLNL